MTLPNSPCHPRMPQTFICPSGLGASEQSAHVLRFSLVFSSSYPSLAQYGLTEDKVRLADGCLCPTQGTVSRVYDSPLFCTVCRWGAQLSQISPLTGNFPHLYPMLCNYWTPQLLLSCQKWQIPSLLHFMNLHIPFLWNSPIGWWVKMNQNWHKEWTNYPFTLDRVSSWLGDGTAAQYKATQGTLSLRLWQTLCLSHGYAEQLY